ncbi:hypothetical protein [Legionella gresilensis]|uniref:hypothetical protein n=1 Tax=Legionella gresilensis TaxID=91823 RepID=UPI0010417089|nr:hypothetical protein [Legionella gresilensis]
MNLLKLIKNNQEKYTIKIDGYYYDKKEKATKLILKIRNKRAVSGVLIKDLLKEKKALTHLSPIDLCIIGILFNNFSGKRVKENRDYISISDNFLTHKLNSFLKIVGRNFSGKEEILRVRIQGVEKEILLPASELFRNQKILAALQYQDALSIGFSLSGENLKGEILRKDKFNITWSFYIGIFLSSIFTSILLSSLNIPFHIFQTAFEVKGEIIMLPFVISSFFEIIRRLDQKETNNIILCSLIVLITFITYYYLIVNLPLVEGDRKALAFNNLYIEIITSNVITFIISINCSNLLFIYIKKLRQKLYNSNFNRILFYHLYLYSFFMFYIPLNLIFYQNEFFLINYLYCSISIIILAGLTKNISNKIVSLM